MSLPEQMTSSASTGEAGTSIGWNELSRFMREHYWNNDDNKDRKQRAATRQRFYTGKGDAEMYTMLGQVFKDPEVIRLRAEWIQHAKFNNVLRRAVKELATVYSQPATRVVDGDENNAAYQTMQRRTRMHEVMQRVNQLSYLHRAVFIYPRVRVNASGAKEPVTEVVTPDRFDAIAHPSDPTLLLAISIDLDVKSAAQSTRTAARIVLTATETIEVDSEGQFILASLQPHDLKRIPGVFFAVEPPGDCLIDSTATDDLEAAHRAVWFENILLLKESKSATKSVLVQGDVSATARQQADDTEHALHLQDGASATTLDRAMDLSMFRATAQAIYETAAANHGIPPSTLSHGGVQSADARELTRAPLKELRLSQHVPLRDVERELAEVQAVAYGDIDDCKFSTDGWSLDFADPQTPLGQKENNEVFETERRLGLTSTIAEVMRRNPDLSREQAKALIAMFGADETWRNRDVLRPMQQISGSPGADVPGAVNDQAGIEQGPVNERGDMPMEAA